MAISKEERLARYKKKLQDMKDGKDDEKTFHKLEYFKCSPGLNKIRIIPPMGDRLDFWAEVYKTWQAGPTFRGPIVRPQDGEVDPVGEEVERLKALGDEVSLKRAESLRAKKSNECFIIDRDNMEKGVQGFTLNWTMMNEVLALFADSEYGDITDPDAGFDLKITYTPGEKKTGGGWAKKPQYQVTPSRHQTPLDFPEALECDLFEKYEVGKPTEEAFARAVLAGTEKEFIEQRKAEREAAEGSAPTPAPEAGPAPAPPSPPPPSGSINDAVQQELDEIRAQQASEPKTPGELLLADYWVVEGEESVSKPGSFIQNLVNQGQEDLSCMKVGESDWSTPKEYGFLPVKKSQVGKDLEEALK